MVGGHSGGGQPQFTLRTELVRSSGKPAVNLPAQHRLR